MSDSLSESRMIAIPKIPRHKQIGQISPRGVSGDFLASLASADHRAEDVRIGAVVVAELKLGDVQRHIFFADFVERADNTAFEDRPKTLNRVRVDCADDVLTLVVIDRATRIFGVQFVVSTPSVGREQADSVRNDFAYKARGGFRSDALENASDDVAFALNRTDDRRLARSRAATPAALLSQWRL